MNCLKTCPLRLSPHPSSPSKPVELSTTLNKQKRSRGERGVRGLGKGECLVQWSFSRLQRRRDIISMGMLIFYFLSEVEQIWNRPSQRSHLTEREKNPNFPTVRSYFGLNINSVFANKYLFILRTGNSKYTSK